MRKEDQEEFDGNWKNSNIFFDPDGKPYEGTLMECAIQWGRDKDDETKAIVKQDRLDNGLFISTVWTGTNMCLFDRNSPPLIYETIVFDAGNPIDRNRYSTRDEADRGHTEMLKRYINWKPYWKPSQDLSTRKPIPDTDPDPENGL